jgi:[protein-PII] uridylyltransferase
VQPRLSADSHSKLLRAEDVFYVTDRMHRPITEERVLDELREVLVRTLDRREAA